MEEFVAGIGLTIVILIGFGVAALIIGFAFQVIVDAIIDFRNRW